MINTKLPRRPIPRSSDSTPETGRTYLPKHINLHETLRHPYETSRDTCGCFQMKDTCCLACPLPECLLVLNAGKPRSHPYKDPGGTKTEARAIEIVALLGTHTPAEIRSKLGLRRNQYQRAIVYIQQHTAPALAARVLAILNDNKMPTPEEVALRVLVDKFADDGASYTDWRKETGFSSSTLNREIKVLLGGGYIEKGDGRWGKYRPTAKKGDNTHT